MLDLIELVPEFVGPCVRWARTILSGVKVTHDGVRVRNFPRTRMVPLAKVDRFEWQPAADTVQGFHEGRCVLLLQDGRSIPVLCVKEDRPGVTTVLNNAVNERRRGNHRP